MSAPRANACNLQLITHPRCPHPEPRDPDPVLRWAMELAPGAIPSALRERMLITRIADDIPVLLAHPDPGWNARGASPTPAPVCIWFHGRTAFKELDPGRYLRWVRAGIAACAIDLPGHGERRKAGWEDAAHTLRIAEQAAAEIDSIVAALGELDRLRGAFDTTRVAIGGMSAGGIAALIRLCKPHTFAGACIEATTGDLRVLRGRESYDEELVQRLNPMTHLGNWQFVPLLALHSEADEWIPVSGQRLFIEFLQSWYRMHNASSGLVRLHTWPTTGAPHEHLGFGRVSNEAKNLQVDFLRSCLGLTGPA